MDQAEKFQSRAKLNKALKDRVAKIRSLLPRNYVAIVLRHYPQYDTVAGGNLMDNVRRGTSAHQELTAIYEAIAAGQLKLTPNKFEINEQ